MRSFEDDTKFHSMKRWTDGLAAQAHHNRISYEATIASTPAAKTNI